MSEIANLWYTRENNGQVTYWLQLLDGTRIDLGGSGRGIKVNIANLAAQLNAHLGITKEMDRLTEENEWLRGALTDSHTVTRCVAESLMKPLDKSVSEA